MKFCQKHWDRLRAGINRVGLDGLVSESGAEAVKKMESVMMDFSNKANFDPLMLAHNLILRNSLPICGLALFAKEDICPQCELVNHCTCGNGEACNYEQWTEKAVEGVLAYAKEHGYA